MRWLLLLLMPLFHGCLFQDKSDKTDADIAKGSEARLSVQQRPASDWIIVRRPDRKCSGTEEQVFKEIGGEPFTLTISPSDSITLQHSDKTLLELPSAKLGNKPPYTSSQPLSSRILRLREGGTDFSQDGSCIVATGFLVTLEPTP